MSEVNVGDNHPFTLLSEWGLDFLWWSHIEGLGYGKLEEYKD